MENDQENKNIDEAIMEEYGVGFCFSPTEKQLALYYLRNKLDGEPSPYCPIQECDLYGDKNPWELFDQNSTDFVYVFTKLKKRNRRCGFGTWKAENRTRINDEHGNVLFFKRAFVFELKNKDTSSGHWLMTEFSLQDKVVDDYVLCRIWNKDAQNSHHEEGEEELNAIESEAASISKKRKFLDDDEGEQIQQQKKRLNNSPSPNTEFVDNYADIVESIPLSYLIQELGLDAEDPPEFHTMLEHGLVGASQESYPHPIPVAEEEGRMSETGVVGSMNLKPKVEDLTTLFSVSEIGAECRLALEAEIEKLLANPFMPLLA